MTSISGIPESPYPIFVLRKPNSRYPEKYFVSAIMAKRLSQNKLPKFCDVHCMASSPEHAARLARIFNDDLRLSQKYGFSKGSTGIPRFRTYGEIES